jgi:hypothetical protein
LQPTECRRSTTSSNSETERQTTAASLIAARLQEADSHPQAIRGAIIVIIIHRSSRAIAGR